MTEETATQFAGKVQASESKQQQEQQAELYEQIGRLKMELEWLKKKVAAFLGVEATASRSGS